MCSVPLDAPGNHASHRLFEKPHRHATGHHPTAQAALRRPQVPIAIALIA